MNVSSCLQETRVRRLWAWWEEAFPAAVSSKTSRKQDLSWFLQTPRQFYWFKKYQIAMTHLTTRTQSTKRGQRQDPRTSSLKGLVGFSFRIIQQHKSICNKQSRQSFGETRESRYDRASRKTWGWFTSMCTVHPHCTVLSWSQHAKKIKDSVLGSSEEWIQILYWPSCGI